ncbi:MAG: serine/threonine-protein kinase [Pseudomonadota bacterium]
MLDWERISESLNEALTLDRKSAAEFVARVLPTGDDLSAANRLLETLYPDPGFMLTQAGEGLEEPNRFEAGTLVGPWRIVEIIGRGGMGEVYRAERADGLYDQSVALKIMHSTDSTINAVFERERQRLALMEHPGISRIVDGGTTDDGRPYMAMELVDGTPIDQHCSDNRLTTRERIRLVRRTCMAVSHAHGKLILHRDIKTSNVLVDSSGQPRLIDFGIAATLGDDGLRGGPLTLYCAAPEQLMAGALSAQTDVFGMGVLLHEVLLGTRPRRQKDGGMSLSDATALEPDLRAILSKAMATDAADRYLTIDALAEDLGAWLEKLPVAAREGGVAYRLGKLLQRAPLASTLAAGFVLALVGGTVFSLRYAAEAQAETERAQRALARAQWQFNRSEANLAAQQSYSDILQRAFGGDKTDELSAMLVERWESAWADRESDPDTAAATSYAVGRNFFFRSDTKRALEIFDPWMESGIGPAPLIEIGEEVYALMLATANRNDEANPRLRELIDRFETGFQESDADLFNYAFKLAVITKADEDLERAETVLLRLIPNDKEPFETLFHQNQLGFLRLLRNERAGALTAFREALRIFEENPQLAAYGRDIVRFNVALQELGLSRDLDAAESLTQAILTEDFELKGESAQQARALLLMGMINGERGALEDALSQVDSADALFAKYSGPNSSLRVTTCAVKAAILADAGMHDEASLQLGEARALINDSSGANAERAVSFLELYTDLATDNPDTNLNARFESEALAESIRGNGILLYWFYRLVERGALDESLLKRG